MKSQEKMLSNWLLSTKRKKPENSPKLETEKVNLQGYQYICCCFCSVFVIWEPCMCQAGCWAWWVFDLNQRNLDRCLVVGEEEERRSERQLWVQQELGLVSLVRVCFCCQLRGTGGCLKTVTSAKQNLPCSARGCPCPLWHAGGLWTKGIPRNNVTTVKCFADCTGVEIHRSTIITSILSPNLILFKVILGLGIA